MTDLATFIPPSALPTPMHIEHTRQSRGVRYDLCGQLGRIVASTRSIGEAQAIIECINAHDALTARVAELEAALREIAEPRQTRDTHYTADEYRKVARAVLAKGQP